MYSEHTAAVAAPPHRRRRPALSCVQCRRRKIKCDQKKPCNQCERSKDTVCSYGSDNIRSLSKTTSEKQNTLNPVTQQMQLQALGEDINTTFVNKNTSTPPTTHIINCTGPLGSGSRDGGAGVPKNAITDDLQAIHSILPSRNIWPSMVYSPDIERHVVPSGLTPDEIKEDRPTRLKAKLVGETHWMNQIMPFDKVLSCLFETKGSISFQSPSELLVLLHQCKKLGRITKSERPVAYLNMSEIRNTIPAKNVCDELVGNYLRTFESIYRIIHIPSFLLTYEEYWSGGEVESDKSSPFFMLLLLVLAIGSTFQPKSSDKPSLRSAAQQWVHTAVQWFSAPLEKSRMNIAGIQIQCLLVLAREVLGIGADLLWISAGSLLRSAMQLGYHRDPKRFPGMSVLHGEMRRRLWATVMELGLKESLGTAMPPLITMSDFDTEPPANINDIDINQETKSAPTQRELSTCTQTSLQIIMLQSLPTRLELARVSTNFRSELTYEEVLRLHTEITKASRKLQSLDITSANQSLTPFQNNYIDYLVIRRPLIFLHRPWAVKARIDPRFYFSRKVCLDTCQTVASYSPSPDYLRLLAVGNGICLEISNLPPLTIALEVIMQLEEEALNPLSPTQAATAKSTRETFIQAIRNATSLKTEDGRKAR